MHVPGKYKQYSPEFPEEAARMLIETSRPTAEVARELGVHDTTLGNWVRDYRKKHTNNESPLQVCERARLREQEREIRELKTRIVFLEKAAAYFAAERR
jgi:transposase